MLRFQSNRDKVVPLSSAADRNSGSWLGPAVRVKGNIIGTEDLVIHGSVEGTVKLEQRRLTVGPAGKLAANINAREVVVYGFVKGDVRATGSIEIKRDGSVTGNLTAAQIMIEDGADFKGSIEIERNAAKAGEMNLQPASAGARRDCVLP